MVLKIKKELCNNNYYKALFEIFNQQFIKEYNYIWKTLSKNSTVSNPEYQFPFITIESVQPNIESLEYMLNALSNGGSGLKTLPVILDVLGIFVNRSSKKKRNTTIGIWTKIINLEGEESYFTQLAIFNYKEKNISYVLASGYNATSTNSNLPLIYKSITDYHSPTQDLDDIIKNIKKNKGIIKTLYKLVWRANYTNMTQEGIKEFLKIKTSIIPKLSINKIYRIWINISDLEQYLSKDTIRIKVEYSSTYPNNQNHILKNSIIKKNERLIEDFIYCINKRKIIGYLRGKSASQTFAELLKKNDTEKTNYKLIYS